MKWNAAWMLPILLSVSACETAGRGSYCDNAFPIYLDRSDVLSDRTEKAIITHNEKGRELCRWVAPH